MSAEVDKRTRKWKTFTVRHRGTQFPCCHGSTGVPLLGHRGDRLGHQQFAMSHRLGVHSMQVLSHHRDLGEVFASQRVSVLHGADENYTISL